MSVTLYTKTVCPKCTLVKTMLTAMEVEYKTKNMDEDEEAKQLIVDKGFLAAPVLQVGDEFIGEVLAIQAKVKELI